MHHLLHSSDREEYSSNPRQRYNIFAEFHHAAGWLQRPYLHTDYTRRSDSNCSCHPSVYYYYASIPRIKNRLRTICTVHPLYRNSIPNFHILHLATHLYHDSGALVSQDNRAGEDEVTNATSLPIMNIASTNTSLLNVYSNVVLVR